MKTTLNVSVLLNLGLLGGLIFMVVKKQTTVSPAAPPLVAETSTPFVKTAASPRRFAPCVQSKTFRWSQLESTNYHAYIKNLRGIGCPEPTLRAIAVADIDRLYDGKYQQLEQQLTTLMTNSWSIQLASFGEQQSLKDKLHKLPDEEAAEIAELLGLPQPVSESLADTTLAAAPVSRIFRHPSQATAIALPLIFQDVNPRTLDLNPDQIQAIAELRQKFWNEIGGPNQDTANPAYRERWKKAQPEMDNMLRGMIGTPAFLNYQLAAMSSTTRK
jgi:hypothetical protein